MARARRVVPIVLATSALLSFTSASRAAALALPELAFAAFFVGGVLRDAPARALFLPYTQSPPRPVMTLIVKPSADQRRTIDAVVPAIARHDPRLKVKVTTLADQAAATVGVERFAAATATTVCSAAAARTR